MNLQAKQNLEDARQIAVDPDVRCHHDLAFAVRVLARRLELTERHRDRYLGLIKALRDELADEREQRSELQRALERKCEGWDAISIY